MYNLGIDQGGTKTVAIVAGDDGRILGRGFGAGACHFFDGLPKAMAAVETAVQQALAQAGLTPGDLRAVSAGMAGANWPEEISALESGLRELLHVTDVRVCNDCVIALRGGTASPRCAVICAGTGLNVAARLTAGPVFVYNNYIEDMDQGARALGARALQSIFLSEIGALPSTILTDAALAFFGLDRVELLLLAYQRQQLGKPVQAFSPLLFAAAEKSDRLALDVLYQFALSISRYPIAAIQKHGAHQAEIDIVLSGGLFKAKGTLLQETIATEIHRVAPAARVIEAEYEPVVGAILQLLDTTYQGAIPPSVMQNCRASAEKLELLRSKSK
jgi:N-acetylglucosamine kinase-like BadF-type ATPase